MASTSYEYVPAPFRGYVKANTNAGMATISTPAYTTTDGAIGGGAVGVVPFGLHWSGCSPGPEQVGRYDGVLQTTFVSTSTIPILIKSYGPFKASTGSLSSAVVVESCDMNDACHWVDVTPLFTVNFSPGIAGDSAQRTMGISSNSIPPPPGIYRVRINSGKLVCKNIDAAAGNVVLDWPVYCSGVTGEANAYEFRIGPDCTSGGVVGVNDLWEIYNSPSLDTNHNDSIDACDLVHPCDCDWNRNGTFEVQDIFDFLNDWLTACTSAQIPPPCYGNADFNHVSGQSFQDIFDFLSCWFANQCY